MKRFYRNFVPLAVAIPCWFYYANMTFRPLVSVGASLPPAQVAQFFAETPESASNPFDVFQVYWKPSATDYTTNAGLTTLEDLVSGTYPLTNTTAAGLPTRIEAGIDGQDYLEFDGSSDYLRQFGLTNAQPNEVWMVAALIGDTTGQIWDSTWNGARNSFNQSGQGLAMFAGSTVSLTEGAQNTTNRWIVFRVGYDGASSFLHTNFVQALAGNANTQPRHGMTLGAAFGANFNGPMQFAWAGVINSNLTAAAEINSVSNRLRELFPTAFP